MFNKTVKVKYVESKNFHFIIIINDFVRANNTLRVRFNNMIF